MRVRMLSPLMVASQARARTPVARTPVVWTAVCPHGRDMAWTAVQSDTRAVITCHCMCPEEAA